MNHILPGLALLLLLGGAGLGFAYTTIEQLQEQIRLLSNPDLLETLARMRSLLDLLVFAWSASFGLLGIGHWLQRPPSQKPDWERRLAQLIQNTGSEQQEALSRLETLLATRQTTPPVPPVVEAPPPPPAMNNALAPIYAPSSTHHHEHTPPPTHSAPRLAIGGPVATHDKQDEEFEPY